MKVVTGTVVPAVKDSSFNTSEKSNFFIPTAGPLHVSSHLNGWAITLCLLT
jgi:hypothetical protein